MKRIFRNINSRASALHHRPIQTAQRRHFRILPKTFGKLALTVALATLAPKKARAAGGVEPPPNPARWATTANAGFTYMHGRTLTSRSGPGFEHARVNYNLFETPQGPVAIFEQLYSHGLKADGLRVGYAQEVSLPGEVVAKLGVLSPQTGKNPSLRGTDFGLILTQQGNPLSFELHAREGATKTRASLAYDLSPHNLPNPEVSFGTAGYFGSSPSVRMGFDGVERAFRRVGLDLGNITTGLGFNIPLEKGSSGPLVDVYAIKPIGKGTNLGASFGVGKETTFKGFLTIQLGRQKRPQPRRMNYKPKTLQRRNLPKRKL